MFNVRQSGRDDGKRLNPRQRAAVEHLGSPLLVWAGAGTGKTRVVIERVGFLLESGVEPEHVLALTYTNEAATEMRQRAAQRFGPKALRARFSTFHAFCYEILREGLPLRAIDAIDHWILLRRNLEHLDLRRYFKLSEPGRFLSDLVDFCSRCHDNLVSPADYRDYVANRREVLEAEARAGVKDATAVAEEIEILEENARVFERSESLLAASGALSFGAMISRAVEQLRNSPEMTENLRRRFRHILVDEFQDTNEAQLELLRLLAGETPSITVVGDSYQAIYRFRGASHGSLEQFKRHFSEHTVVELTENYRSTPSILAVAHAVASRFSQGYDAKKTLVPTGSPGPKVEIWEFADADAQAEYTAEQLQRALGDAGLTGEREIAVLYRAHVHRGKLVAALRRRGVPFRICRLAVNRLPVIRDILAYLRVLGDPEDSISLVRILSDARWKMDAELLAQHCRAASEKKISLGALIAQSPLFVQWETRAQYLEFVEKFRSLAAQCKISEWFALMLNALGLPRDEQERPAVQSFQRFVETWEQEKSNSGCLSEFLEYFRYFEEAGGSVNLPQEEEEEIPRPPRERPAQGTLWELEPEVIESTPKVQLMTLHAAKGLEFDQVFLFHLVRNAFPAANRQPLISLPPELWKGPSGDTHLDEERRLLYVGVTRARRRLTLCTISNDRQKPSVFIDDLRAAGLSDLVVKRPVLKTRAAENVAASDARENGSRISKWALAPAPPHRVNLKLSASQIETYEQCPLKYWFHHVWRIPARPTAALSFGAVMHGAVQDLVYKIARERESLRPESTREILDKRWESAIFSDAVQERKYRQIGLEQLEAVRQLWSARDFELIFQERPFETSIGGFKLVGRIDQLSRDASGLRMIEYKTGRPQTPKEAAKSLQVTLYAYACAEEGLTPQVLTIFNLSTGEELHTERGAKDFAQMENRVREAGRQIQAGVFPGRPGFHCRYCPYESICPEQEEFA